MEHYVLTACGGGPQAAVFEPNARNKEHGGLEAIATTLTQVSSWMIQGAARAKTDVSKALDCPYQKVGNGAKLVVFAPSTSVPMNSRRLGVVALSGFLLLSFTQQDPEGGTAQELPPPIGSSVDFVRDVEPIFESRCYSCHGPQQQSSGLRLDRREDALRGGNSGPSIQPGTSAQSKLIHLVAGIKQGEVMPLVGDRLTRQEIGILRTWIDGGADWPVVEDHGKAEADTHSSGKKSSHWSFQPIQRPPPPGVGNRKWLRNPIDAFILARLEEEGIAPSRQADQITLIRRLSLDLIGLPPAPEDISKFLIDNRPDAYERLVDRLLESEHYGEKWAAHWLDLARYADSDGYEKDWVRPHAWRYRHWVIDALNRDVPFNQFTIEQIAGDLLPKATTAQKVATGFHRNTLTNREGGVDIEQFRFEQVIDRANTVGTVWLGLTVGCAQCHDHKYDPISQKDYYRFFAFFDGDEEVNIDAQLPGEMGPYLQALPGYLEKRRALLEQYGAPALQPAWEKRMLETAANPGKWTDWDEAYDAFEKTLDNGNKILRTDPAKRTLKERTALEDHFARNYNRVLRKERQEELKFKELYEKLVEMRESFPALSQAQTIATSQSPVETHIHLRGDYQAKGIRVRPGAPKFLNSIPSDPWPSRLSLARWITAGDNPLTARVTVNRIWQELFGQGLVRTPEDFGTQGERPSHPKLLDWLADEFMARGWSIKAMIKTIVTSAAYRQSSQARPSLESSDPDNVLLARQSRLRLSAELIRDVALAASGLLNPSIGGKSVRPPQPEEVIDVGFGNSVEWEESRGSDRYRRGLYIHFQRTVPYPFLMNFDASDKNVTSCRRNRSNTPLQALNLLNDPVFLEAAQALATRTLREVPESFDARLGHAFRLCLARNPRSSERKRLAEYFRQQEEMLDSETAQVLFPLDLDGVDRIQAAAWVGVSSVLLNLDEFVTRE